MPLYIFAFTLASVFLIVVFVELALSDSWAKAKGYGPKSPIDGEPCATGYLSCLSFKVPKLGGAISFDYAFRLYSDKGDVTGVFEQVKKPKDFSGGLFFSFADGRVKGRSFMSGLQVFEGDLGIEGARLTRGHPKGGMLSLFNGAFNYSIRDDLVSFDQTSRTGSISKDSQLLIEDGQISGRLFHGPQKTWAVDVEVSYADLNSEAAALAVILACDHVLKEAHDGW